MVLVGLRLRKSRNRPRTITRFRREAGLQPPRNHPSCRKHLCTCREIDFCWSGINPGFSRHQSHQSHLATGETGRIGGLREAKSFVSDSNRNSYGWIMDRSCFEDLSGGRKFHLLLFRDTFKTSLTSLTSRMRRLVRNVRNRRQNDSYNFSQFFSSRG